MLSVIRRLLMVKIRLNVLFVGPFSIIIVFLTGSRSIMRALCAKIALLFLKKANLESFLKGSNFFLKNFIKLEIQIKYIAEKQHIVSNFPLN